MDALVIVDPLEYQRRSDEPDDPPVPLRTLHFGRTTMGWSRFWSTLLTTLCWFVRIQWLGEARVPVARS